MTWNPSSRMPNTIAANGCTDHGSASPGESGSADHRCGHAVEHEGQARRVGVDAADVIAVEDADEPAYQCASTKHQILTKSTLIPDSLADSEFPPTATVCRPKLVLRSITCSTPTTASAQKASAQVEPPTRRPDSPCRQDSPAPRSIR